MFDEYRPADFAAVAAFARRQPEFDYLQAIIRAHEEGRVRGAYAVWREAGRVVAFCAVAFPNQRDAWLYGMRVDNRFKKQGIATRLTRALFGLARQAGRTWAGLDTKDIASKAPVFRICNRLGMTHLTTHATTMLWNIKPGFARPRLEPAPGPWPRAGGARLMMRQQFPLWIWQRPAPETRLSYIAGARVSVEYDVGSGRRWAVVNAFERPPDTRTFVHSLLGLAHGRHRGLVLVSPAAWQPALRRTARALVPRLARGVNSSFDAWRIYGRRLK
jgi:GNAT superfamily N-acetyltransferase